MPAPVPQEKRRPALAGAAPACEGAIVRSVVQRVARAEVRVHGERVGAIGRGLAVLLGVAQGDDERAARLMAEKVAALRIFEDAAGKMNLAVAQAGGQVLVVSQFTLLGDARKGNRPSFAAAAPPGPAEALYERFCAVLRERGLAVATGVFRAEMELELVNDGPVTILLDSERTF
jgi:D-tyrosyl-tRNA(Tyr) deacylase